jgi:hypothetical protein
METIIFNKDIKVLYVPAKTFPDGILEAHKKLHSLIPFSIDRKFFGISRPENGVITYKAAAEEINKGEAETLNSETMILRKGRYASMTIKDFRKDPESIGKTFEKIVAMPDIDPEGYCVEWYFNEKDVRCMVRLNE